MICPKVRKGVKDKKGKERETETRGSVKNERVSIGRDWQRKWHGQGVGSGKRIGREKKERKREERETGLCILGRNVFKYPKLF